MLESALIIRWIVSIVIMILLLLSFYFLLRILKEKGYDFQKSAIKKSPIKKDRMQIVEQLYLDSKTKIVKVKDEDKIITILVGQGCTIDKKEIK